MNQLANEGTHRLALVASTRSSSLQRVTDGLLDIETEATDHEAIAEPGFEHWLVRKILAHFAVPDAETIAQSCSGLPVMAAFAGFLYTRDGAQFEKQFGNLAAVKDFAAWSARRLKAIEDHYAGGSAQALLAELAVRLPIPRDEAQAFRAASLVHDDLFSVLVADHWIEEEGEAFSAAHDVFADAMLARHLAARPGDEQNRVEAILWAALAEDRLDRCLAALDRLAGHPVFETLSGRRAVGTLLRRDRERTLAALPALAQSRLLPPPELIALLAHAKDLQERLVAAPEAHLAIARAAEWAGTKGSALVSREDAQAALDQPLATIVAWSHGGNMFLRCAHAFDPARYERPALETRPATFTGATRWSASARACGMGISSAITTLALPALGRSSSTIPSPRNSSTPSPTPPPSAMRTISSGRECRPSITPPCSPTATSPRRPTPHPDPSPWSRRRRRRHR